MGGDSRVLLVLYTDSNLMKPIERSLKKLKLACIDNINIILIYHFNAMQIIEFSFYLHFK